jgi:hypothetical protein
MIVRECRGVIEQLKSMKLARAAQIVREGLMETLNSTNFPRELGGQANRPSKPIATGTRVVATGQLRASTIAAGFTALHASAQCKATMPALAIDNRTKLGDLVFRQ